MQENTNKAIAVNTAILYIRMGVLIVCSLFTTRFALQALGVNDFGLFNVVGSVITFVAIINTTMVRTTNRFIAVSIGKGEIEDTSRIFNVSLVVHVAIAFITTIIAFPVGDWYIHRFIHYNGLIENAYMVFHITITGSILSFIAVPFQGLLTAKENFVVFCSVDMISHILKLTAAYLMLFFFDDKLFFYASTQAVLTAIPSLLYWIYCHKYYKEITKWKIIRDRKLYREMLGFSGWVGFGALATVAKAQAAQLLVNAFFNTVMNAALGVANTINHFIMMFASNITTPMAPQITKSYSAGDINRCNKLLIMSTKFSFLLMLLVSSPFFSDIDWILQLWLGNVPPYASAFTILLVLDALIASFNSGITNIIFANGKIAFFQITINTINLLSVIGAFIALKMGAPVYSVFIVYIIFTTIKILFNQLSLKRVGGFKFMTLFYKSYLPSILVSLFYVPILFVKIPMHPLTHMSIVFIYLCFIVLFVGLKKNEREYIKSILIKAYYKKKNENY